MFWFFVGHVFSVSIDCPAVISLAKATGMNIQQATMYNNLNTGNCCNQNGVSCDGNGRVNYVNWGGFNLNGVINGTALNLLTELTGFELYSNLLSGPLPPKLPNKVTLINIGGNALSGPIVSLPPNLVFLHIDSNDFNGVLPPLPNSMDDFRGGSTFFTGAVYAKSPSTFTIQYSAVNRIFIDDFSKFSNSATYGNPQYCGFVNTNVYATQVDYLAGICQMSNIIANTECGVVQQIATNLAMNVVNNAAFQTLTGTCCSGIGIICTGANHIIGINWSSMNLNGALDTTQIELLYSYLQSFNVSNNKITGSFSKEFTTNMLTLDLGRNKLKGNLGDVRFTKMRHLNLANNEFNGTLMALPPSLMILNISNNNFSGTFPQIPSTVNNFDISYNFFSGNMSLNNPNIVNIQRNLITDINFNRTNSLGVCNLLENNLVGSSYPLICLISPMTASKINTRSSLIVTTNYVTTFAFLSLSSTSTSGSTPTTNMDVTTSASNEHLETSQASTEMTVRISSSLISNDAAHITITSIISIQSLEIRNSTSTKASKTFSISKSTLAFFTPIRMETSIDGLLTMILHGLVTTIFLTLLFQYLYKRSFGKNSRRKSHFKSQTTSN